MTEVRGQIDHQIVFALLTLLGSQLPLFQSLFDAVHLLIQKFQLRRQFHRERDLLHQQFVQLVIHQTEVAGELPQKEEKQGEEDADQQKGSPKTLVVPEDIVVQDQALVFAQAAQRLGQRQKEAGEGVLQRAVDHKGHGRYADEVGQRKEQQKAEQQFAAQFFQVRILQGAAADFPGINHRSYTPRPTRS